jgi:cysteine-rich repeat protein
MRTQRERNVGATILCLLMAAAGSGGADQLQGGAESDALIGGPGADFLFGKKGEDFLDGREGADVILGGQANDELRGGDGADDLDGGTEDDLLLGRADDDDMRGSEGNDDLLGGPGADEMAGGPGDDTLRGGPAADDMDGGPGNDMFLVPSSCEVAAGERIAGGPGHDRLFTPLTQAELLALGVTLKSIEEIVVQPDPCSGHGQCVADGGDGPVTCECEAGFAGPACAFTCTGGGACEIEAYRNANGSIYALAGRSTALFVGDDAGDPAAVLTALKEWIAAHPQAFGFKPLAAGDLQLAAHPALASVAAGGFLVHRFVQTYQGHTVFGPDGVVTVTTTPAGALFMAGTVADPHGQYGGLVAPIAEAAARAALEQALEGHLGQDVTVGTVSLMAFPRLERLGYVASGFAGSLGLGLAAVGADLSPGGEIEVLFVDDGTVETIDNQAPVSAVVEQAGSNPFDPAIQTETVDALRVDAPLTGADEGTEFRLAQPLVFGRDLSASTPATYEAALPSSPSFTSPDDSFNATPPSAGFFGQDGYVKTLNMLHLTQARLNGGWDSLLRQDSDFAPGTFAPRVLVTVGALPESCSGSTACAKHMLIDPPVPAGGEDFLHVPFAGGAAEPLGRFALQIQPSNSQLTHEFGHIVDLFVGAGFPQEGVLCQGQDGCMPSCVLGTDQEAPPLQETVANMYGMWALPALFDTIGADDCETLLALSLGGDGSPHNDTCRPDGEDFSIFNPGSLTPGIVDGSPTGACDKSDGYRFDAVFQAWWELLAGEVCSPTAPFVCQSFAGDLPEALADDAPHGLGARSPQAAIDALLYALRINSQNYEMLADAMAAYYACNFGAEAHASFCSIVEHHGIIVCDAVPTCQVCGNGALEAGEPCDDANLSNTDACLTTCESASCGDGFVWQGEEECDDGNDDDTDECTNSCTIPVSVCGDGVMTGSEECDGGDFGGATCDSLGQGMFGTLECANDCTIDSGQCSVCEPGTPGCRCLDSNNPGEGNPDLREGGILGNGKYCLGEVSLGNGGDVRCVEPIPGVDVCHQCTVGQGVWCPCVPQEGCQAGGIDGLEGPATGQPGDTGFCAAACDADFLDICDGAPADTFGYCFASGEAPEDGGMPDWFPDQYCRNVDSQLTCVQEPGEAAVCNVGPGPACTLE